MRQRHSELSQESRFKIAQQVLGIAVAYGRLQHCLKRLQRTCDAPNLMEIWKRQDEVILFESTEVVPLSTRLATTWSVPQWMAENWLCQFGTMEAWCFSPCQTKKRKKHHVQNFRPFWITLLAVFLEMIPQKQITRFRERFKRQSVF